MRKSISDVLQCDDIRSHMHVVLPEILGPIQSSSHAPPEFCFSQCVISRVVFVY